MPSQVTSGRSRKEAIPTQVTTKNNDAKKKKHSEDRNKKSNIPAQVTTSSTSENPPSKSKKGSTDSGGKPSNLVCMRSGDKRSKVIETRRQKWASLLEKRPQTKDGEAMSTWLMQVLAVSDLWKPLNETEKMPNVSIDLIRECAEAGGDTVKTKEPPAASAASGSGNSRSDAIAAKTGPQAKSNLKDEGEKKKSVAPYVSQESDKRGNSSVNQNGNSGCAENSSNESDNRHTEADGRGATDEDKVSSSKSKSTVLKKRPVAEMKEESKDERTECKDETNESKEPLAKEQKR